MSAAPYPSLLQQCHAALTIAMAVCDATPSRADTLPKGHPLHNIGKLVCAGSDGTHGYAVIRDALTELDAHFARPAAVMPIDMVLHCPACGLQHVDGPEIAGASQGFGWNNPPHRSHLCGGCGHVWRPADVPTNGVLVTTTLGKDDSPIDENLVETEAHGYALEAVHQFCPDLKFREDTRTVMTPAQIEMILRRCGWRPPCEAPAASPVPTTWQERVEAERHDLDIRIRALDALFDTPEVFAKIPPNQQRLLSAQRLAMHTYLGCLVVRLKNGDVDPYTLEPIDALRTAAATLNEAMVNCTVTGFGPEFINAVTAWRRAWLQVDGRMLPIGDEVQPAEPIRKAHAYQRGGR